jgi:hypothetical protein
MDRKTTEHRVHTVADLQRQAVRGVQGLIRVVSRKFASDDGFDRLEELLQSLPLPTHEFAVAANRLANARRYAAADERGAATYELKLLIGGLNNGSLADSVSATRLQ